MTKVICSFDECLHITDVDKDGYGVCSRKVIVLDGAVDLICVGCPNAEWIKKSESEEDEDEWD